MDLRETIGNHNDVTFSLAKHVIATEAKESNLILSPPSINVVLSLIAAGTRGSTLAQLLSFLKSQSTDQLNSFSSDLLSVLFADGSPSGGPRLAFVNGVWIDESLSFKHSFKQVVDSIYKAASNQVDFQTKAVEVTSEVNSWAEKETNGLIKQLLPPGSVDHTTRLIFANALYFKGTWGKKFDPSKTEDYDFHLLNGSSVCVPFMTSMEKQLIGAYDGFKVLGLPYKQGGDKRRYSMYLFLPDAKDGLQALVEKLGSGSGVIDNHIPHKQVEVGDFRIPKFKISFGFEASKTLKELGLVSPFSEGGLTEMVDSPVGQGLHVSSIFHNSFIEVNEEGTEAAAASAGMIRFRSCSYIVNKIDFVADHPFLFLIREDLTGMVLFIGHVLNPLEAD